MAIARFTLCFNDEARDNVSTVKRTEANSHIFTVQRTGMKETEIDSETVTCPMDIPTFQGRHIFY